MCISGGSPGAEGLFLRCLLTLISVCGGAADIPAADTAEMNGHGARPADGKPRPRLGTKKEEYRHAGCKRDLCPALLFGREMPGLPG